MTIHRPYITAKEAALAVGVSYVRMRQLLLAGRIRGAFKLAAGLAGTHASGNTPPDGDEDDERKIPELRADLNRAGPPHF